MPIDADGKYKLIIKDLDLKTDMAFKKGRNGQPEVLLPSFFPPGGTDTGVGMG